MTFTEDFMGTPIQSGPRTHHGAGPFIPESTLPEQWHDQHASAHRSPEHRLMVAVLEDAVGEYQKMARSSGPGASVRFRTIAAWFFDDDPAWIFSFQNICDTLSLEPDYIRRGLMAWDRSGAAAPRWMRHQSPASNNRPSKVREFRRQSA